MKRNMKQRTLLTLVLAAAILFLPAGSVYAADQGSGQADYIGGAQKVQIGGEEGIDPQYINTATITADLAIDGSNAHAYCHVAAKRVCKITTIMRLQHLESGKWRTKVAWTEHSDTGSKVMSKDWTLTKRGDYRVYALFDVDGESLSYISSIQRY